MFLKSLNNKLVTGDVTTESMSHVTCCRWNHQIQNQAFLSHRRTCPLKAIVTVKASQLDTMTLFVTLKRVTACLFCI